MKYTRQQGIQQANPKDQLVSGIHQCLSSATGVVSSIASNDKSIPVHPGIHYQQSVR